jgi:general stress protein 26
MSNTTTIGQEQAGKIRRELQLAGASQLMLRKFTLRYLPRVIHPDEHIEAVVCGRHREVGEIFGFAESSLVATDRRVLYINHQPGYTTMDEVGYENVSGINFTRAGLYAGVTLFTKIATYTLSFANPRCVKGFVDYIEDRITRQDQIFAADEDSWIILPDDALEFLRSHELGVISSLERTGGIVGSAVYYTVYGGCPYFITKSATHKAWNIIGNQHVALTVVDEQEQKTIQVQGVIEVEMDVLAKKEVSDKIIRTRQYKDGSHLPPMVNLKGEFVTFRIHPTNFRFADYSKI